MTCRKQTILMCGLIGILSAGTSAAWAIDVKLSSEDAHKALETGRCRM